VHPLTWAGRGEVRASILRHFHATLGCRWVRRRPGDFLQHGHSRGGWEDVQFDAIVDMTVDPFPLLKVKRVGVA